MTENCRSLPDQEAAPLLSREEAVETMMGTYSYRGLARIALDNADEIFRLRAALEKIEAGEHLKRYAWCRAVAREALNGGTND